ncbi:uncharacterized protein LOC107272140 isoform X5 [Cephus cinctus]|uniref:Uncharacterized protein LOC107272140 isoform X5 n=1 Tax=Cephus cinctus TaxID=211228 RepID=A0AAJ7W623_CEPCN|nr:uncharacterized protein LOC107272140 isoform X5 [Cephus cinctus]
MAETADFGPRKTILILAIVAGCFAVLWPKIFHPMLTASVNPPPTTSDSSSACCDVIFESDVTTVDIMQEMCQNILRHHQVDPRVRDALKTSKLTPQSASLCREEVLARCGIDLSSFLAERERLGKTYKQVLEEIRSFNSSLCLKMNFGVPLSQLGTPHLIRYHILMPHSTIKQERRTPPHAGGLHPALRERGRAIPTSHIVPKVEERSEHVAVPKMRPPMGGAAHVVSTPKGNGTMGIIMPLYTLGIVLFFLYTIVKVLKKNTDNEIISEYPGAAAEKEFRKMVFSPEALASAMTGTLHCRKERSASPARPAPTIEELKDQAAGDIEIDQLRRRLVETEAAMERIVVQMGNLSRSVMHTPSPEPELKDDAEAPSKEDYEVEAVEMEEEASPTVKIMGMEMTASCEGGQRCSRPSTPVIPSHSHVEREKTPPKPIYLEGALPSQCELLVTDSETQEEKAEEDAEAPVVLSGKMTLSLISLDQIAADSEENEVDENPRQVELRGNVNSNEEIESEEEEEEEEEEEDEEVEVEEKIEEKPQKLVEDQNINGLMVSKNDESEEEEEEEIEEVEEEEEEEEIEEEEVEDEEVEDEEEEEEEEEEIKPIEQKVYNTISVQDKKNIKLLKENEREEEEEEEDEEEEEED